MLQLFSVMTSLLRHSSVFRKVLYVFWQTLSITISVKSFIGLALMVPEILGGGVPKVLSLDL